MCGSCKFVAAMRQVQRGRYTDTACLYGDECAYDKSFVLPFVGRQCPYCCETRVLGVSKQLSKGASIYTGSLCVNRTRGPYATSSDSYNINYNIYYPAVCLLYGRRLLNYICSGMCVIRFANNESTVMRSNRSALGL